MDTAKQWYAIKVKWRSEKLVRSMLQKKKIEVYVPLQQKVKQYTRKRVTTLIPMLPCYVFVHIDSSQNVAVLETEYVFDFVRIGQTATPVRLFEIELLKRLEGLGDTYSITEVAFYQGQSVSIANGPLSGMKGVIDSIRSKGKVLVSLESIGITLQVEMDKRLLLAAI